MSDSSQAVLSAKVTIPGDREIRIEREFDAPRRKVWKAFTDRDLIARWWGRGHKLDVEAWEPKPGGHWRFVEHGTEGPGGFEGRFREVTPQDRIVQSFEWDGMPAHVCINTTVFEDMTGFRTRITTTSLFHTREERDGMLNAGMEGGMNRSFAALDRVLETMS